MKKRTLLLVASLIVSLAIATTGTLAYLTDTDEDVNVMTLGNVQIEQHEMKRAEDVAHNATLEDGDLVPFVDGVKLYPAFPVNGAATDYSAEATDLLKWGPYVHTGTAANGLWNDAKLKGAVDKMVFVENTGSSDAYFRTIIAFECPEGITIGEPSQGAEIMINTNGTILYKPNAERKTCNATIDGQRYTVFEFVYQDALLPGEWSHPSLLQVVMTHNATNEDMEKLGDTYEILVLSQAVQTTNFESIGAEKALNTAFGEFNETNVQAWFTGIEMPTKVATPDELVAALAAGEDVILMDDIKVPADDSNGYGATALKVKPGQTLNGGGKTITATGAGGTWDSAITTNGGTINDLTIGGGFRGVFVTAGNDPTRVILNDVVFDGPTYTISCDQGANQGLTANDCTFNGWTSYAATIGDAVFNNCSFGEGAGYAYMRPYAPTECNDCTFEEGFVIAPLANITLTNCKLGDTLITAENFDDLDLFTDITKVTIK